MKLKTLATLLLLQLLLACASPPNPPPPAAVPAATAPANPVAPSAVEEAVAITQEDENSIYFALGKAQLSEESERKLSIHAALLKANPKLVLRLLGHTDNLGSSAYNLAISEKRVMRVRQFLLATGVKPAQVVGYGIGNELRSSNCATSACRQKMRRVELIYQR